MMPICTLLRSSLAAALLLATASGLTACGDRAPSNSDNRTPPGEPTPGGELVIATLADADRLDPHLVTDAASMRVIENMYSTLLRYGDSYGDFENDLAESIILADDQRTYTITLVKNAVFHSGRPVTAQAVRFSIERIKELGVRSQQFEAVTNIDTPDDHTVVITLDRPVAPFLSYLAYPMNAIVDPQVVADAPDNSLASTDAGSGPFKLANWQRDRTLTLARHEQYHIDDRPLLDSITFQPIADETSRTTALRTGEVHLALEVAPKDVQLLEQLPDVHVQSRPGTFWEYIGLNCAAPPFDDVRVRQAAANAVDRDMLNKLVKRGRAVPLTGGHIPENHWAHAPFELYPKPNIALAKRLMAQAGHTGPVDVELIVDTSVSYQVRAAEVIKQQLAPAGFSITIAGLDSTTFFDRLGKGNFQMTIVGWMGFVDPDEWTWELFHSEGKYNQQQYANPQVDQLLDQGRRTPERDARKKIYAEAQRLIAAEAPMVFLYVNPQTSAWRSNVYGYAVHPTASTRALMHTWIAD